MIANSDAFTIGAQKLLGTIRSRNYNFAQLFKPQQEYLHQSRLEQWLESSRPNLYLDLRAYSAEATDTNVRERAETIAEKLMVETEKISVNKEFWFNLFCRGRYLAIPSQGKLPYLTYLTSPVMRVVIDRFKNNGILISEGKYWEETCKVRSLFDVGTPNWENWHVYAYLCSILVAKPGYPAPWTIDARTMMEDLGWNHRFDRWTVPQKLDYLLDKVRAIGGIYLQVKRSFSGRVKRNPISVEGFVMGIDIFRLEETKACIVLSPTAITRYAMGFLDSDKSFDRGLLKYTYLPQIVANLASSKNALVHPIALHMSLKSRLRRDFRVTVRELLELYYSEGKILSREFREREYVFQSLSQALILLEKEGYIVKQIGADEDPFWKKDFESNHKKAVDYSRTWVEIQPPGPCKEEFERLFTLHTRQNTITPAESPRVSTKTADELDFWSDKLPRLRGDMSLRSFVVWLEDRGLKVCIATVSYWLRGDKQISDRNLIKLRKIYRETFPEK